ncbi:DUF4148 domain-containing protein [Caballeronia sp. M23-90]
MKFLSAFIAILGIAVTTPVFAEHAYRLNDVPVLSNSYGGMSDGTHASNPGGKTRAEVYSELIQAQRDGIVPSNKTDYPPSQRTIERNRELYSVRH